MAKYQQTLREICSNAESKRITDRRSCLTKLLEIYKCDEAVEEIHAHSRDKSGVTWAMIMHSVHTVLLSEIEQAIVKQNRQHSLSNTGARQKDSKSSRNVASSPVAMLETVKRANSCEILLRSDDIMSLIIQFLSSDTYADYHKTYFAILICHVLPVKQYQTEIEFDSWKQLLNLCMELYVYETPTIEKRTILEALVKIVHYGCRQSHLILHIKKMFKFLVEVVNDVRCDPRTFANETFELLNETCQQMGAESRMTLCEFGESVLPHLISVSGDSSKYDWILLILRAHHPGGSIRNEAAAYAYDWKEWNELMRSIYQMILNDCQLQFTSTSFVQLACEVSWQLKDDFVSPSNDLTNNEGSYTPTPKRRRTLIGIQGIIDATITADQGKSKLFIEILTELIARHPSYIGEKNFLPLMQFLIHNLNNCSNSVLIKSLWELGDVLLKSESKVYTNSIGTEEIKLAWDKIWHITLRSVSMNENLECVHGMLQSLVVHKKMTNPSTFLNLYVKNSVQWSKSSIRSLVIFCRHNKIKDNANSTTIETGIGSTNNTVSIKRELLNWVLNIPSDKWQGTFPIEDVCELLIGLVLTTWYPFDATSHPRRSVDAARSNSTSNLTNLEDIYLLTCFESNMCDDPDSRTSKSIDGRSFKKHVSFANQSRDLVIDDLVEKITVSDVEPANHLVVKTALIARVFSDMKQLGIIHRNVTETLDDIIKQSLEDVASSFLAAISSKKTKPKYIPNVLDSLHLLYTTTCDTNISNIIRSSTDPNMLKQIVVLMGANKASVQNDSSDSDGQTRTVKYMKRMHGLSERHKIPATDLSESNDTMSDTNKVRMSALETCMAFSQMPGDNGLCKVQEQLQITLLSPDQYDLLDDFDLQMALFVLNLSIGAESVISDKVIGSLLKLLQKLCRVWYKYNDTAVEILNVLSRLSVHLCHVGQDAHRKNVMRILNCFHELLRDKKCGPTLYIAYVGCLETLTKVDPDFAWTIADDRPILETLLEYLKNPFHAVRFAATRCLRVIFSSRDIDHAWLREFFAKTIATLPDLFVVRQSLADKEKADQRANRVASAMHVLVVIATSGGSFNDESLLKMLKMTVDKKVNPNNVKKLLENTRKTLKRTRTSCLLEINVNYALTHWLENEYSLTDFPWTVLDCTLEDEFLARYVDDICIVLVRRGQIDEARNLCAKIDTNFANVFEGLLPRLLAWILPRISNDDDLASHSASFIDVQRAKDVWNVIIQLVSSKLKTLVENNLHRVVLCLFERLHDEHHFTSHLDVVANFPAPDPPHFLHEDIKRGVDFLTRTILRVDTSFVYLLVAKKAHVLQKVLLSLKKSIHRVNSIEHKLKAMHRHFFFCTMVVSEIDQSHFDHMATYVVRDVTHTLINLIRGNFSKLTNQVACEYLYFFCEKITSARHDKLRGHVKSIVATLLPIAESRSNARALDLLRFLLIHHGDKFQDALERLDSFPSGVDFEDLRRVHSRVKHATEANHSLDEAIERFLEAKYEQNNVCSKDELSQLHDQLASRRRELGLMYRSLQRARQFSEDSFSRKIHRLVCALAELATSSDSEVALSAAKCLGELGPANLSTMILRPANNSAKSTLHPMVLFVYRVTVMLSNFLVDADVDLVSASSEALYVIMSSYWARNLTTKGNTNVVEQQLSPTEEILRMEYIAPFLVESNDHEDTVDVDFLKCTTLLSRSVELWMGNDNSTHSEWVTNLVCAILDCFYAPCVQLLIPVCKANVQFCEKLFPWVVQLLVTSDESSENLVHENLNRFFEYHYSNAEESRRSNVCFDHESVQCVLNVVAFLRLQSSKSWESDLNFLHVAKAAQYCSAYFTSVLYAELWCDPFLRDCRPTENSSVIDHICQVQPDNGRALQNILREAYVKIGDPDAIYGCGSSYLLDSTARIEHYVQLRKWDKVLLSYDVELSLENYTATKGLLEALQRSGLEYLMGAFAKTIGEGDEDINVWRYECAWRLSEWNVQLPSETSFNVRNDARVSFDDILGNDYAAYHYQALKAFHESDENSLKLSVENARASIVKSLRNVSLESCKTVYPVMCQLQMLREIEDIYFSSSDTFHSVMEKWSNQDSLNVDDFEYIEPILSQRMILLRAWKSIGNNEMIIQAREGAYLKTIELAMKHGHYQIATKALGGLAKETDLSKEAKEELYYNQATLAWTRDDQDVGRLLLRNLLARDESLSPEMKVRALRVYGNWMAETKSENPQNVIRKYYEASIRCSERIENRTPRDDKNLLEAHAALARFADAQYHQIESYMKSSEFENLKECIAYSEIAAQRLDPKSKNYDEKRAAFLTKNRNVNDIADMHNVERDKYAYLLLAVEHYVETLQRGEEYDLLVFRLVSLWLDNTNHEELNEFLETSLEKIPSYKFVVLVPQLAPHISDTMNTFSSKIYKLLERCAMDHPHHTLPVLLSLMNLHNDQKMSTGKKSEPRVLGAKKLINELLRRDVAPIVREMEKLSCALITLANLESPNSESRQVIPRSQSIHSIKNFNRTLVPTLSIDVKVNKSYDRIVSIEKYTQHYDLVGGVNAPKKVTCHGTDGIKREQLVKGKDDLRQDAVMQQVFTIMNVLLRTSKETNKRKLHVRTYKVVPLTQRSGVLEWCENTLPLSIILEGSDSNRGLHAKYYPKDYTTALCRKKMSNVSKESNETRLKVFMDCCAHLHPVFHYFFLEQFLSPDIWFERRLAYTHSVATSSIIGYVLGLGDRHVKNILIDQSTAEMVHIDFGIAFEQGKLLPTPETVPFRLTRDIEVAMGVSGVEGVLRQSCHETMNVLRSNREIILTLLYVLLYDPLFTWVITPARAYSHQLGAMPAVAEFKTGEINKLAERALLRLDQKLRGMEDGSASSVTGQVEQLIQQARDPSNLSRLYSGWQPYL